MLHIGPETNGAGEILPHPFVFPNTFFTFIDKWNQTVLLNLLFPVQAEHLFNFQFYRQTMGIPSGLSRHLITFHRLITWNHIFDNTGQHMANMRFSVGRRRSIVKCIFRSILPGFNTLFENVIFLPEFFYVLFSFHKIHIRRNFFVHHNSSFYMSSIRKYSARVTPLN